RVSGGRAHIDERNPRSAFGWLEYGSRAAHGEGPVGGRDEGRPPDGLLRRVSGKVFRSRGNGSCTRNGGRAAGCQCDQARGQENVAEAGAICHGSLRGDYGAWLDQRVLLLS